MKKSASRKKSPQPSFQEVTFDAIQLDRAALDIGNDAHYAAVHPSLCNEPIRRFSSFTADLESLADWLMSLGITSVAMESTGVYWLGIFEILERRGLEVILVNARFPRNVTGRKSDVSDSAWLQKLHSHGLLENSFIPDEATRALRIYVRQRQQLVNEKAAHLNRIGKALQRMNVKLQNVISDIGGKLGMKVIRAIVSGNHAATELVKFYTRRLKESKEVFLKALQGNFTAPNLFSLQLALEAHDLSAQQMKACEQKIEQVLHQWQTGEIIEETKWQSLLPKKPRKKNDYSFEIGNYIEAITEVDLLAIEGLAENTTMNILAEVGTDMTRWKNHQKFVSWLKLAPQQKISGDKLLGHFRNKNAGRAHQAFKLAAYGLVNSKGYLGNWYRSLSHRKGSKIAIKALARKLAVIFYNMMKYKTEYKPRTSEEFKQKTKKRKLKSLKKLAEELGFELKNINTSC